MKTTPLPLLLLASAAFGAPIIVHNTGVNSSDVLQTLGSTTSFWTLASQPAGAGHTIGSNPFRYHHSAYYADGAASGWVSPASNGLAGAMGVYTFQLTFDLSGLNPSTAIIEGTFGTDNYGSISLNRNAPVTTTGFEAFGGPTGFTFNSHFISGINTITVSVTNGGDPTAFRVEFTRAEANLDLAASDAPEPATLALVGGGLTLMRLFRRRT